MKNNTDDTVHMPINIHRIIKNAKNMFGITNRSKTDLKPVDVISKLSETLNKLVVVPSLKKDAKDNGLLVSANENSTMLMKIYMKSILNTKNVIVNERLNQQSLDWILGEVQSKFQQSLVHPGEMVGSIAAQGLGEPAT